jgi:hypothetical protein
MLSGEPSDSTRKCPLQYVTCMYENRTIKSIRIVKKKRGGWDKKVME